MYGWYVTTSREQGISIKWSCGLFLLNNHKLTTVHHTYTFNTRKCTFNNL